MQRKKWLHTFLLVSTVGLVLAGCSDKKATETSQSTSQKTEQTSQKEKKAIDLNALDLPQIQTEVAEDESLVEMVTSMGSIKIKLFPKITPKTVENFITHAKKGYYNNTTFHRVINEFMIQGGDPKGDGTGGESIWGKPFKDEFSNQLYNIRGAVSMANSGPNTNGSQFFIVQNNEDKANGLLKEEYPDKIIDAYKKGGTPYLDHSFEGSPQTNHAVFGQVIEGMDVVDKIAAVDVDEQDKPKTPVTIKEIKVIKEAK